MGQINPAEFARMAKSEPEFWWHRGMRRIIFRLLDPLVAGRSIRTVLEAGWGTGYFARLLQKRYEWRVFPLAFGWEGQLGVERLAQSDLAALPFESSGFDAVVSVDILGSYKRGTEGDALKELARVLAPGGLLIIRVGAFDMFRSRHSEYVGEQQRFRREGLISLMERCGIRMLRSTYANALLSPVALAKFRIWEPLTSQAPANALIPMSPWLDHLLYAPLAAESYWLGAGLNFPFGQTLLLIGEKPA